MGSFSWLFADTNSTKNLRANRRGYVACPDGTFICEPSYETYGIFDGKDIYDLVVDWNRKFIAETATYVPAGRSSDALVKKRKSATSALTLRAMTRITPLSPIPSRLPARRQVFAMRNFLRVNGTLNRDSASTVRGMYDGRTS